ncbi:MAG TPA: type II secretion system F family protein [Dehalococcoidia bacterium]|nr:type II secretion system F family protein [Dehalococcoidia bacterium]
MSLLIAACVFISVAGFALSIATSHETTDLDARLGAKRTQPGNGASGAPPSGLPLLALSMARRFLPSRMLDTVQLDLIKAGNPTTLQKMVLTWSIGVIGIPLVYAGLVLSRGAALSTMQLVSLGVVPFLGFFIPRVWLKGQIAKRRKRILKALPDAMDLITTSVEAGLGIDAAFARVADKVTGPLAEEFRRCLREMSLGHTRREALTDFAGRTELPDITTFINAVIQAEHTGVSLGRVVRIQADQLRTQRKQRAEQEAQKAPVKMVIPLVLFIFPAMFIVILGPAAIQVFNSR